METTSVKQEYAYSNSNSGHHHAYLLPLFLPMLPNQKDSNKPKLRVLDIGCGNGSLSHVIAQNDYEVVGVEESESGFKFAGLSYPNFQFIQASIYDLPYSQLENSFDIVIFSEVVKHLFYPRELLKAAKKCLQPSSRLILLTTPYHGYAKNLVMALSGKMDKHFRALWDGGHIKFFSVPILTLLETKGFTDIKFKFASRLPYLWKSMLCSCFLRD